MAKNKKLFVEDNEIGYHESHHRYYAKATKLYFTDGLGYRRISKLFVKVIGLGIAYYYL